MVRPYFGMHRFEWPDDDSVEFHLGHGDMIRLLRDCGLEVEDLIELRPETGAITRYPFVTLNGPGNGHVKKSGRPANQLEHHLHERRRGAASVDEHPVDVQTIQNWSICVRVPQRDTVSVRGNNRYASLEVLGPNSVRYVTSFRQ